MKTKLNLIPPRQKKNWLRVIHILTRRKLQQFNVHRLLVFFSAILFLVQLMIIVSAVSANPAVPYQTATYRDTVNNRPAGPLKIGDKVPDLTISNIMNYKTSTVKMSDFRGKLLVLDFWASWCKACLEFIPHSDSTRKTFGDQMEVLYVTYETRAAVDKLLERNRTLAARKLPIVFADISLKKLFPHRMVPHLVWIDPNGRVLQTTASYDFTKPTIQKILQEQKVEFKAPKVDLENFDATKPLFDHGNGGTPSYIYRSLISAHQPGIGGSAGRRQSDSTVRLFGLNQTVPALFKHSLRLPDHTWKKSRILYEGIDRSAYEKNNGYEEAKAKEYCYELVLPAARVSDMYRIMHGDLERFFGIQAKVERRRTTCLILKPLDKPKFIKGEGETKNNLRGNDGQAKFLKNEWLITLVYHLNDISGMPPVLMEGIKDQKLNLQLNKDLANIPHLNKALAEYGLTLQKEVRDLDMLILSPHKDFFTHPSK
jgi:thiol-disulfide isomerase/thioredoxin